MAMQQFIVGDDIEVYPDLAAFLDVWTVTDPDGVVDALALDTDVFYRGSQSMRMDCTGAGGIVTFERTLPADKSSFFINRFYTTRVMVRLSEPMPGGEIGIYQSYGNPESNRYIDVTKDGLWQGSWAFGASDLGPDVQILLHMVIPAGWTGSVWFDAVSSLRTETVDHLPPTPATAIVWPYNPDWDAEIEETLVWLTGVMRAERGAEGRTGRRTTPRRRIEYTTTQMTWPERQALETLWRSNPAGRWYLPWWTYERALTQTTVAFDNYLWCDTTSAGFTVGGWAFVWNSPTDYLLLPVLEVLADRIKIHPESAGSPITDNHWRAGAARVVPVLTGRLSFSLSEEREFAAASAFDVVQDAEVVEA